MAVAMLGVLTLAASGAIYSRSFFSSTAIDRQLDMEVRAPQEVSSPTASDAGVGRPNPPIPQKPSIALLYTGHVRTHELPEVRGSHARNLVQPLKKLGYRVVTFYAMGKGNFLLNRRGNSGQHSPDEVRSWMLNAGADEVIVETAEPPPTPPIRPKCRLVGGLQIKEHQLDQLDRFWNSWWRVRNAFGMMKRYEAQRGAQFEIAFRVRPDFYFFNKTSLAPLSDALSSGSTRFITTPDGRQVRGQRMNDWAVACHRSECASYFDMLSLWENCTADLCCWGWGHFYDRVLEYQGVELRDSRELFPVTLVRPKYVACHRISDFPDLIEPCYRLGKQLGMPTAFTCEINGRIVVDRRCPAENCC